MRRALAIAAAALGLVIPGLYQMVIVTPSTRSTAHSRHDFLKREERIGAIGACTRRFASDELANLERL